MDVLSSPWNDAKCDENLHRPNIAVYLQINMTLDFSIFRLLFNKGKLAMTDHCKVQKNMVVLAPCVMFRFYFSMYKVKTNSRWNSTFYHLISPQSSTLQGGDFIFMTFKHRHLCCHFSIVISHVIADSTCLPFPSMTPECNT